MHLSRRVTSLAPSATIAMMNRAKALIADGVDVLSFSAGEPDFDTPERIKQAAVAALAAGQTKYMPTAGDAATRRVIAEKLAAENGIPGLTPDHIIISSGGKHSLYVLMQCLFDKPEDHPGEAIIPVPAWVSYRPLAEIAGAKVVELPTGPENGFRMTADQLRAAITRRTRCVFINSPSNPCGTMYTPNDLRELAKVVAEAAADKAPDLLVISDEIYEKIVYGGVPHFSIGSVPEVAQRTVTVNGLSKAYAMTGWRIGYAACPGVEGLKLIKAMTVLQGQMTTNITSFCYPAIRTALTECADEVESMRLAFARRAEVIYGRLCAIPGLLVPRPNGAFYAFPDISAHFGKRTAKGRLIESAHDFAEAALEEALIAVVAGEDFGGCGRNCIRISFACSEEHIGKGMDRLGALIASLK